MYRISLWAMVIFYVAAGSLHFFKPGIYLSLMPSYIPWHLPLIYISGAFEICFAVMLIPRASRPGASYLIIALLIAIFPANVHMAISFWENSSPDTWLTILRLPLQLVLIWWAWQVGHRRSLKQISR